MSGSTSMVTGAFCLAGMDGKVLTVLFCTLFRTSLALGVRKQSRNMLHDGVVENGMTRESGKVQW